MNLISSAFCCLQNWAAGFTKKKPKLFINVGVDRKIMEAVRAGEIRRVFRSKCEIQVSYFAKLKGVLSRASTAPIGPRSAKEIDAP